MPRHSTSSTGTAAVIMTVCRAQSPAPLRRSAPKVRKRVSRLRSVRRRRHHRLRNHRLRLVDQVNQRHNTLLHFRLQLHKRLYRQRDFFWIHCSSPLSTASNSFACSITFAVWSTPHYSRRCVQPTSPSTSAPTSHSPNATAPHLPLAARDSPRFARDPFPAGPQKKRFDRAVNVIKGNFRCGSPSNAVASD